MPTFTIRMSDSDHEALHAMAILTGKTMAELVREAIIEKVTRFANDEQVERQIEDEAARKRAVLKAVRDNTAS